MGHHQAKRCRTVVCQGTVERPPARGAAAPKPLPPVGQPCRLTRAELKDLIERVRTLPDVREDKVREIREALAGSSFDLDGRLERLLELLPADLLPFIQPPPDAK